MSVSYCFDCLTRTDECTCDNPSGQEVFGEYRRGYAQGYRDAQEGKDMEDIIN